MKPGESEQLTYTIDPGDFKSEGYPKWTSDDPSVATVDQNGKVTGIKAGQTTVSLELSNSYVLNCSVYVVTMSIDEQDIKLEVEESQWLHHTITPQVSLGDIVWASSDTSVLTVDENGQITGVKAGTVTVTATAGDFSASTNVTVFDYSNQVTVEKKYLHETGDYARYYVLITNHSNTYVDVKVEGISRDQSGALLGTLQFQVSGIAPGDTAICSRDTYTGEGITWSLDAPVARSSSGVWDFSSKNISYEEIAYDADNGELTLAFRYTADALTFAPTIYVIFLKDGKFVERDYAYVSREDLLTKEPVRAKVYPSEGFNSYEIYYAP